MGRERGRYVRGLFDAPLWRDWTVWLGGTCAVGQISALWKDPATGQPPSGTAAALGNMLGLMGTALLVFAVLPAWVRLRMRREQWVPRRVQELVGLAREVQTRAAGIRSTFVQRPTSVNTTADGAARAAREPVLLHPTHVEGLPVPAPDGSVASVATPAIVASVVATLPTAVVAAGVPRDEFAWDVALSFAGEDRAYVEEIARSLKDRGVRVFYDRFVVVETWGTDLYRFFDEVYRKQARFAVLFVSEHYVNKAWTRHESQSAQARALESEDGYVLPVRLDESELRGLRPTIGYLDARQYSASEVADFIVQKCRPEVAATSSRRITTVPLSPAQEAALLVARPPLWEYLLFVGLLVQRREALDAKWRDHQTGYATPRGRRLSVAEALANVGDALHRAAAIVANVGRLLSPRAQEVAFGQPGMPGDPQRIEHLAGRLADVYEAMLDWSAELRSTSVAENLVALYEVAGDLMTLPLTQFREFVDEARYGIEHAVMRVDVPGPPETVTLTLAIAVDPVVTRRLDKEMRRVRRNSR